MQHFVPLHELLHSFFSSHLLLLTKRMLNCVLKTKSVYNTLNILQLSSASHPLELSELLILGSLQTTDLKAFLTLNTTKRKQ